MSSPTVDLELALPAPFREVVADALEPYVALLGEVEGSRVLLAASASADDPDEPGVGMLLTCTDVTGPDAGAPDALLPVLVPRTSALGTVSRLTLASGPAVLVDDLVQLDLTDPSDPAWRAVLVSLSQVWLVVPGLGMVTLTVATTRVDEREEHASLAVLLAESLSWTMAA